jgi:hypothetical protein
MPEKEVRGHGNARRSEPDRGRMHHHVRPSEIAALEQQRRAQHR